MCISHNSNVVCVNEEKDEEKEEKEEDYFQTQCCSEALYASIVQVLW